MIIIIIFVIIINKNKKISIQFSNVYHLLEVDEISTHTPTTLSPECAPNSIFQTKKSITANLIQNVICSNPSNPYWKSVLIAKLHSTWSLIPLISLSKNNCLKS